MSSIEWQGAEERDKRRKEQSDKQKAERLQLMDDMKAVLATPGGRRVMANILVHCRMTESNFTGNSETFKLEGKREVALALSNWMGAADANAAREIIGEIYVRHDD